MVTFVGVGYSPEVMLDTRFHYLIKGELAVLVDENKLHTELKASILPEIMHDLGDTWSPL